MTTRDALFQAYLVAFRSQGVPAQAMRAIEAIADMTDEAHDGFFREKMLERWAYCLKYAMARL